MTWLIAAMLTAMQSAHAEDYYDRRYQKEGAWSQMFGIGMLYIPEWEGDDELAFHATPLFDFRWRERFFISSRDGIGFNFYRGNRVKAALSIGYMPGRSEGDSANLTGLGDISTAASVNLFTTIEHQGWLFGMGLSRAITGDHDGMIAAFSADRYYVIDDETTLNFGTTLRLADEEYMQAFYSINAAQSAASSPTATTSTSGGTEFEVVDLDAFENVIVGFAEDETTDNDETASARDTREKQQLPTYEAGAGLKDMGVHLNLYHKWDDNWGIGASATASQMLGDAADNPLVDYRGKSLQLGGGLYLTYTF